MLGRTRRCVTNSNSARAAIMITGIIIITPHTGPPGGVE